MIKTYVCTFSPWVKVLTALTLAVVIFAVYTCLQQSAALYVKWLVPLLLVGALLPFVGLMPRRVELTDDTLTVVRLVGRKQWRLDSVNDLGPMERHFRIRLMGSGGFCGYLGWFSSADEGAFFGYIADPRQAVMLRLRSGRKYAFSVNDREAFLTDWSELTQPARTTPPTAVAAR